jgi:hypothetical protein
MTESQKSFIEKNMQIWSESVDESQTSMIESTSPSVYSNFISNQEFFSTSPNTPLKFEPMIVEDCYPVIQSCLGTNDSELLIPMKQVLTCIFCQENSEVKLNSEALVLSAYVQKFVEFRYFLILICLLQFKSSFKKSYTTY